MHCDVTLPYKIRQFDTLKTYVVASQLIWGKKPICFCMKVVYPDQYLNLNWQVWSKLRFKKNLCRYLAKLLFQLIN